MTRVGKLVLELRRKTSVKRPGSGHALSIRKVWTPVQTFLGGQIMDLAVSAHCRRCGFQAMVLIDMGYSNPRTHFHRLRAKIDRRLNGFKCKEFQALGRVIEVMES